MQPISVPLIIYLSRRKRYRDSLLRQQKRLLLTHLILLLVVMLLIFLMQGCSAPPPLTPVAVKACPQIPALPTALQQPRKIDHLQQAQAFVKTL